MDYFFLLFVARTEAMQKERERELKSVHGYLMLYQAQSVNIWLTHQGKVT